MQGSLPKDMFTKKLPAEASLPNARQAGEAGKAGGAPVKKAEVPPKKPADADPKPAASAPIRSKHGKKPPRDQQSTNQALQLFSHLQQYRVIYRALICLSSCIIQDCF